MWGYNDISLRGDFPSLSSGWEEGLNLGNCNNGGTAGGEIYFKENQEFKFVIAGQWHGADEVQKDINCGDAGFQLTSGNGVNFKYTGKAGLVYVHADQTGSNSDDRPWIWLTRSKLYLKHAWNGGEYQWSSKEMIDNQDGTYTLYAQYSGTPQASYSTYYDPEGDGWGTVASNNITVEGSPVHGDFCEFKLDFTTGTSHLTIRKLPETGTLGANGWGTFYSESNYQITGATAYIATALDGDIVTISPVSGIIPARTALVLKGTVNGTYSISYTLTDATANIQNNKLHGTATLSKTENLKENGTTFMALNSTAGEFQIYTGDYFPANKAYLLIKNEGGSNALRIRVSTDEVTAVENVETEEAVKFFENGTIFIKKDGRVYNAMGQLVK